MLNETNLSKELALGLMIGISSGWAIGELLQGLCSRAFSDVMKWWKRKEIKEAEEKAAAEIKQLKEMMFASRGIQGEEDDRREETAN